MACSHTSAPEMVLNASLASHWGDRATGALALPAFDENPWVRRVPPMEFEAFQAFLADQHVVLDLFDETEERRLAMVTRTVVALASGTPVIHPPFTEVSPLLDRYEAGWLIDPGDTEGLASVLDALASDREQLRIRSANAKRLWVENFEPAIAARAMADLLVSLEVQR